MNKDIEPIEMPITLDQCGDGFVRYLMENPVAELRKYRGKPVVVEAVQLSRTNASEIKKLIGEQHFENKPHDPVNLYINTGHGTAVAQPGTWVVKDSKGRFYPCEDATFQEKYELAAGVK